MYYVSNRSRLDWFLLAKIYSIHIKVTSRDDWSITTEQVRNLGMHISSLEMKTGATSKQMEEVPLIRIPIFCPVNFKCNSTNKVWGG